MAENYLNVSRNKSRHRSIEGVSKKLANGLLVSVAIVNDVRVLALRTLIICKKRCEFNVFGCEVTVSGRVENSRQQSRRSAVVFGSRRGSRNGLWADEQVARLAVENIAELTKSCDRNLNDVVVVDLGGVGGCQAS
jgi:hypothetical protein